jgi:membrane protein YdbS with pleckstrin-like domain
MYDELERRAKKKVDDKVGFFITATVFGFVAAILFVIWLAVPGGSLWIMFPALILGLVLGIIYLSMFGIPFTGVYSKEWQEEEIEREMAKMYYRRRKYLPPPEELTEEDRLELEELERLKEKWEYEDYDYDQEYID